MTVELTSADPHEDSLALCREFVGVMSNVHIWNNLNTRAVVLLAERESRLPRACLEYRELLNKCNLDELPRQVTEHTCSIVRFRKITEDTEV